MANTTIEEPLLSVDNLSIEFQTHSGPFLAVEDSSFVLRSGEILGVVGESGCGKSVTSLAIMGLLPSGKARVTGGQIIYNGQDLLTVSNQMRRRLRGREISMIFQEPMSSLNPVYTVGEQIVEAIRTHERISKRNAFERAIKLLDRVGIPSAKERAHSYPHELSGGMRQRAMIAMALALNPKLIIADEPTTALDVTIQAQILELLRELRSEFGTAILLITHDLGVIGELAERVAVMYAGQIVETALVEQILKTPEHPYTAGLLASIPPIEEKRKRLATIPGSVPNLQNPPNGCRFEPRCPLAIPLCRSKKPTLSWLDKNQASACHRSPLMESLKQGGNDNGISLGN